MVAIFTFFSLFSYLQVTTVSVSSLQPELLFDYVCYDMVEDMPCGNTATIRFLTPKNNHEQTPKLAHKETSKNILFLCNIQQVGPTPESNSILKCILGPKKC